MRQDWARLPGIVRHEFGHLVAAKLLGFSTGGIELIAVEARAQIGLRPTFNCLTDVAEYARRRVQVLYAAGAQALGDDGIIDPGGVEQLLKTTSRGTTTRKSVNYWDHR